MQQERFNIFNQIHKGLRAMLYHTALKIQQTNFAQTEEAGTVLTDLEELLHYFEQHAQVEDRFILPAVTSSSPQLVVSFENEHGEDERLSKELFSLINNWKAAETSLQQQAAGRQLFYAFNDFVAFNLHHINKEERLLNHALWKAYSDAEIQALMQQIHAALPPATLFAECRWMIRGMNSTEIIQWLQEVNNAAPEEVFQALVTMAEEELPAQRWVTVHASLADAVMVQ